MKVNVSKKVAATMRQTVFQVSSMTQRRKLKMTPLGFLSKGTLISVGSFIGFCLQPNLSRYFVEILQNTFNRSRARAAQKKQTLAELDKH